MPKRTIPQIREELKRISAQLRLAGFSPLFCDDLDTLAEETRRSPNKPKELTQERINAPLEPPKGKRTKADEEAEASDLTNAIDDFARGLK